MPAYTASAYPLHVLLLVAADTLLRRYGMVVLGLELIPGIGILFSFTNTVGAALWAADLEKQGPQTTAPKLREEAARVE